MASKRPPHDLCALIGLVPRIRTLGGGMRGVFGNLQHGGVHFFHSRGGFVDALPLHERGLADIF